MSNEYQSIYHYCMESFTIIRIFNAAMSAHLQMDINLITVLSSPNHFIACTYQTYKISPCQHCAMLHVMKSPKLAFRKFLLSLPAYQHSL